ncbi:hypothetical protein RhiirA4_408255, partial [Rhizophagus irregularis]
MPALVFEWNLAGFNDVATAPGLRNGVANQDKATIITNLTANGATNYNIVFTFPNGTALERGAENQMGVPDVVISVTRINQITKRDTGIPSIAFT